MRNCMSTHGRREHCFLRSLAPTTIHYNNIMVLIPLSSYYYHTCYTTTRRPITICVQLYVRTCVQAFFTAYNIIFDAIFPHRICVEREGFSTLGVGQKPRKLNLKGPSPPYDLYFSMQDFSFFL